MTHLGCSDLFAHIAYDPTDPVRPFVWTTSRGNRRAGRRIGTVTRSGYSFLKWKGQTIQMHKLVYYFHTDHEPQFLDHIDQDKSNNTIDNLRPATAVQNALNIPPRKNKTSQYRGVGLSTRGKWKAAVSRHYKMHHIGTFKTEVEAALAVDQYVRDNFGADAEFFKFNFPA